MKYAVVSTVLSALPLEDQVALCRDLGFDGLEIDGSDPAALAREIPRLLRVSAGAGVALAALASRVSADDPDAFAPLAVAAESLGVPLIRINAPVWTGPGTFELQVERAVAGLEAIEAQALRHHVKAAVAMHPDTIAPSASAVRRLLEGFDPEAVGAVFDPGGAIHGGLEAWPLAIDILGPYLAHVHVANALWVLNARPAGGPWEWAPRPARLREGAADWRAIMAALAAAGYDGTCSIGDQTDQPVRDKLEDALAYLKGGATA